MRLAWQPAFQSGSLERYSSLMDDCAARLCDTLASAAGAGERVDVWRALGGMTMGVVGTTAFGIDMHTLDDESSAHYHRGRELVRARVAFGRLVDGGGGGDACVWLPAAVVCCVGLQTHNLVSPPPQLPPNPPPSP